MGLRIPSWRPLGNIRMKKNYSINSGSSGITTNTIMILLVIKITIKYILKTSVTSF